MSTLEDENINKFIECVFGFTLNPTGIGLLSAQEFCTHNNQLISLEDLEQILFDRVLIHEEEMDKNLIGPAPRDHHILESEVLTYLFECFYRLFNNTVKALVNNEANQKVKDLVIRNICTALKEPGLYETENLVEQIVKIFESNSYSLEHLTNLFTHIVNDFIATESEDEVDSLLLVAFQPLLTQVMKDFYSVSLLLLPLHHFDLLQCMASVEKLALVLVRYSEVPQQRSSQTQVPVPGYLYEKTLFGAMLNISCLPKHHQLHSPMTVLNEFFNKPLEFNAASVQSIEGNVWFGLDNLLGRVTQIFHQILKTKNLAMRNRLLSWIGDCLRGNSKRGKLWTSVNVDLTPQLVNISDAMAFNLTAILLRLSKPIVTSQEKYMKIEPTYCAYDHATSENVMGIHLTGLHTETCLLPHDNDSPRPVPTVPLTFISECYWITQRSLDLSVRVMLEKLNRTNQDLGRLQATYLDAMQQGGGVSNSPVMEHMKKALALQTSMYMAYRTVLLHPSTLSLLSQFQICTSVYLVQLLLNVKDNKDQEDTRECPPGVNSPQAGVTQASEAGVTIAQTYAPLTLKSVAFPMPQTVNPVLKCIPEFVIENLWSFLYLVRHHKIYILEENADLLEPTLTTILAFMGTNRRIRNPHLRAKLAECLECLLPLLAEDDNTNQLNPNLLGNTNRIKLFTEHPHRLHLVQCVLDIFVGIEMTGESVEFEQKFNYRRPMYAIMGFLWNCEEHRAMFVKLAQAAETHIHSDRPPLFLRFVNLLMNDAVFLLDEALSNMAQIRTLQTARENGEWSSLPSREQEQNQSLLQHTGMMARFDNILGSETIHTLEYLTSEIRSIFCHSTMVDRMAAMLNYFLYHLVGPKKKNFKVKDMQEFKFSPATIVLNICKMYVHLGSNEEFCAAVSRDGRSYSPQLFQLAEGVLARIGGADLIPDLRRVAFHVEKLGAQLESDEALLANAPEEYLDAIMNTIMIEPVTLPSSKQTLDKSTIARHLLSDQSDPFNRSPLTMEQVIPNTALQMEIQAWIRQCRDKGAAGTNSTAGTNSNSGTNSTSTSSNNTVNPSSESSDESSSNRNDVTGATSSQASDSNSTGVETGDLSNAAVSNETRDDSEVNNTDDEKISNS